MWMSRCSCLIELPRFLAYFDHGNVSLEALGAFKCSDFRSSIPYNVNHVHLAVHMLLLRMIVRGFTLNVLLLLLLMYLFGSFVTFLTTKIQDLGPGSYYPDPRSGSETFSTDSNCPRAYGWCISFRVNFCVP